MTDSDILNSTIDAMFTEAIKEKIPGIMASAVPGVGWSVDFQSRLFCIEGRWQLDSGEVVKGYFAIALSTILDHDGAGKGWVERCKTAVMGQIRSKIDKFELE